jgi:hypothetical protein
MGPPEIMVPRDRAKKEEALASSPEAMKALNAQG